MGRSPVDLADAPPDERLSQLRSLLLGDNQDRLERIEMRLADPAIRADDIGSVLAEAIDVRAHRNRDLQRSLQPVVEEAFRISVQRNPKLLAAALYPVVGEAVRKSVARSLKALVNSLNQIVEMRFSIQSLRWRWEALTTGRTFGEIALSRSLTYRVEQLFLIHREKAFNLHHVSRSEEGVQDSDMVSGMVVALQDFVHDSFGANERDRLEEFAVGDFTIWVQYGPEALLAGVLSGTPPSDLHAVFQRALERIHRDFSDAFALFDGDVAPFAASDAILRTCFAGQDWKGRPARPGKSYYWLAIPLLLLIALLAGLAFYIRDQRRWSDFVARVRAERGIVLVSAEKHGGDYVLSGLRDPFSADPAVIASRYGFDPKHFDARFQLFQSLDPAFVSRRALASEKQTIDQAAVRFSVDSAHIDPGQISSIDAIETAMRSLTRAGVSPRLVIRGHADETGGDRKNFNLSVARAAAVLDLLRRRGIPEERMIVEGLGSKQPLRAASDVDSNRRVAFSVDVQPPQSK